MLNCVVNLCNTALEKEKINSSWVIYRRFHGNHNLPLLEFVISLFLPGYVLLPCPSSFIHTLGPNTYLNA